MNRIFLSTSNLILVSTLLSTAFFTACVPARKVEEMKSNYEKCKEERNALASEKQRLETELAELKNEMHTLRKAVDVLERDTLMLGTSNRKMQVQYDKINQLNDELLAKLKELKEGSESANKALVSELGQTQEQLQAKEDELRRLEIELNAKKANIDKLSLDLEDREKRVKELEDLLAEKDAKVKALKDKIAEALLAFKDKGLTVTQKNGKVYVSLEAKLLFASGSTVVDKEGKKALVDLAKVLEDQTDLEVLVEGHTDTDAIRSSSIPSDNWELSVLRATSVVKIMMESSKMNPKSIVAAGRSEFHPVDPDDKAKNRRIEVILTPNLDELYKLIENE